jgi:Protein of unknown function (DUF1496)
MAKDVCYYDDKEYSAGSIIEVDGEYQECVDTGLDYQWVDVPKGKGDRSAEMRTKAGICYYDGKRYSVGAKVKMPNGETRQCTYRGGGKTGWFPLPE